MQRNVLDKILDYPASSAKLEKLAAAGVIFVSILLIVSQTGF